MLLLKLRLPSSSAKFVSNLAYIRNVVKFFIFLFYLYVKRSVSSEQSFILLVFFHQTAQCPVELFCLNLQDRVKWGREGESTLVKKEETGMQNETVYFMCGNKKHLSNTCLTELRR